ncbi:hypothetical protein AB0F59_29010 [Micromonospora lupini]|uniref:hypothetical protein n=1 Tax=Micromonospora lupini TaxID=285679 RepID=UPI0033CFE3D2
MITRALARRRGWRLLPDGRRLAGRPRRWRDRWPGRRRRLLLGPLARRHRTIEGGWRR